MKYIYTELSIIDREVINEINFINLKSINRHLNTIGLTIDKSINTMEVIIPMYFTEDEHLNVIHRIEKV